MPASSSDLSEAELHGLVDGYIDADRRADVLRRAVASPAARKRVEAWQEQAELIRSAFRGIDKECLPTALDLRMPPRLHSVPPTSETSVARPEIVVRRRIAVAVAAVAAVSGIGGWLASGALMPRGASSVVEGGESSRSLPSEMLAQRTADVLASTPMASIPASATTAMPTSVIPDLTPVGFTFSGADAQYGDSTVLVFRYRGTGAEQVVVGITSAKHESGRRPARASDGALTWRAGANAYAVAGTVAPERLRAVVASLRAATLEE